MSLFSIQNLYIKHLYTDETTNSTGVPSEYSFQSEFFSVFRSVLSTAFSKYRYRTLVEGKVHDNGNNRRRLDILIHNGDTTPVYGFELEVAPTRTVFRDHVERASQYARLHNTINMFLVTLCPKPRVDYFQENQDMQDTRDRSNTRYNFRDIPTPDYRFNQEEAFVFPENVTPVNVTIEKTDDVWMASLQYRGEGQTDVVYITGSEWQMEFVD
ncbi:3922_t:CDS:1, partial [Paraglomus occultum]